MSDRILVDRHALYQVLTALNGPGHLMRELQVIASMAPSLRTGVDDPIGKLIGEYNAFAATHRSPEEPFTAAGARIFLDTINDTISNREIPCPGLTYSQAAEMDRPTMDAFLLRLMRVTVESLTP